MNTRTTAAIAAGLLLATLTACGSSSDDAKPEATASTISQADRDAARKAAGLPTEPSPEARAAFLKALNAIDTRIIKPGKDDQAVSRGINQCGSIKSTPDDTDKLIKAALDRFTVTTRLPEISTPETGKKILNAVHKHLCPNF